MQIDIKLHKYQRQVYEDRARFRVLVAGRRFGKTVLACNELLISALSNNGSLNWYVAPYYRQAKSIAWLMVKSLCRELPDELTPKYNESELSATFPNNARIELKGADNSESLLGVGVKFLVVDEFASIPNAERVWEEILRPMLSDTQGRALFIGTPKGLNAFYTLYQKGVDETNDTFSAFRFPSNNNPFLPKKEVEHAREELHPRMFEQEYMCSFLTSAENVLIKIEDLEELKDVRFHEDRKVKIIGCDPSLGGDECVIYVLENTQIVDEKIIFYDDPLKIAGEITELAHRYDIHGVAIDNDAIGKAIVSHLKKILKDDISIIPVTSGGQATDKDRFTNRRTEIWWHVWKKVKDQRLHYPEDIELRRQLSSVEYKVMNNRGKVGLVPKKKTKEILGQSPDRADAFIYGIWGLQHVSPRKPNYYKQRTNKWITKKDNSYGWSYKE